MSPKGLQKPPDASPPPPPPPAKENKDTSPKRPGTSGTELNLRANRQKASTALQRAQRAEQAYRAHRQATLARQDAAAAREHFKMVGVSLKDGVAAG